VLEARCTFHDWSIMRNHSVPSDPMSVSTSVAAFRQHAAGMAGHDLEAAVDRAMLAPSLYNSQPWQFVLQPDRLEVRADRTRHLPGIDPLGRELVQSVGAALFNARAALAACGWAVDVTRLPNRPDPDLMAVVEVLDGPADTELAELDRQVASRRTNRRSFDATTPSEAELRRFAAAATAEDALLIPVLTDEQHRLIARLTQLANDAQQDNAAYRAELRRWTSRPASEGDGIVVGAIPHVDGTAHDDIPMRDFDTRGDGRLPASTGHGTEHTLMVLATRADDPLAWLRSGEALQRVLLEIAQAGWQASPITQVVEVTRARLELRTSLTWDSWPQSMLRIGHAQGTTATPRRNRDEVVRNSTRPKGTDASAAPHQVTIPSHTAPRPMFVSDGRGGTERR
jgi:nitroreductase